MDEQVDALDSSKTVLPEDQTAKGLLSEAENSLSFKASHVTSLSKEAQFLKDAKRRVVIFGEVASTAYQLSTLLTTGTFEAAISDEIIWQQNVSGEISNITSTVAKAHLPFAIGHDTLIINTLYFSAIVASITFAGTFAELLSPAKYKVTLGALHIVLPFLLLTAFIPPTAISYGDPAKPLLGAALGFGIAFGLDAVNLAFWVCHPYFNQDEYEFWGKLGLEALSGTFNLLFQVFDLVKDAVFLFFIPQLTESGTDFVFVVTVVDTVLSMLMVAEIYIEGNFKFGLGVYLLMIVQYSIYGVALVTLPPIAFLLSGLLLYWCKRKSKYDWDVFDSLAIVSISIMLYYARND